MRTLRNGLCCAAVILPLLTAALPGEAQSPPPLAPSPEAAWGELDYVHVYFAVFHGEITLPRRADPKTARFFARLVDRGNIELLLGSALTAGQKRNQLSVILGTIGEFRGRYAYAVHLGDELEEELAQILIFRLYLLDRFVAVSEEAAREANVPAAGLLARDHNHAFGTAFFGALDAIADRKTFSEEQVVALVGAITAHYARIRWLLTADHRDQAAARFAGLIAAEGDAEIRTALIAAGETVRRNN